MYTISIVVVQFEHPNRKRKEEIKKEIVENENKSRNVSIEIRDKF